MLAQHAADKHIGQLLAVVTRIQFSKDFVFNFLHALLIAFTSACAVGSFDEITVFLSIHKIVYLLSSVLYIIPAPKDPRDASKISPKYLNVVISKAKMKYTGCSKINIHMKK